MLYIHLDKEHDSYDIIREFRAYYEEKNVNDIIKEFNDDSKDKKIKLDNIFNLLIDFNEYYKTKKLIRKKYLQILKIITIIKNLKYLLMKMIMMNY